jgi:hypothetical protein
MLLVVAHRDNHDKIFVELVVGKKYRENELPQYTILAAFRPLNRLILVWLIPILDRFYRDGVISVHP